MMKLYYCVSSVSLSLLAAVLLLLAQSAAAQTVMKAPRCEIVPLAGQEVSLRIDGVEKTRWHYGAQYPRPFFFPFNGPSGESLTRMGHPGAPNHDHHRSVWFAHHDVSGLNFWTDATKAKVQQKQWLAYKDGEEEALMAVRADWGEVLPVMQSDIIAALRPFEGGHLLELQIQLKPYDADKEVTLGKTNFGFLAVRMAKSISGHFGGGVITSSKGAVGEKAIFGKQARWMDYSGPITVGKGKSRKTVVEGVTYFDHPSNPNHPTGWHVREDGWMGAGFCMFKPHFIGKSHSLTLRYLLHAHSGKYDAERAKKVFDSFASRPPLEVLDGKGVPHHQYVVQRAKPAAAK